MGRKSDYSKAKGIEICEWIASGKTLLAFCSKNPTFNRATVYRWSESNKSFRDMYARAKLFQYEVWFDELHEEGKNRSEDKLSDAEGGERGNSAAVQRSALICNNIKWSLSKLLPKQFGEKPEGEKKEERRSLKSITLNVLTKPSDKD